MTSAARLALLLTMARAVGSLSTDVALVFTAIPNGTYTTTTQNPNQKLMATAMEEFFNSPDFESGGPYPNNLDLTWAIKTSSRGVLIRLTMQHFELESSIDCIKDYVKIYDDVTCTSTPMATYCGKAYNTDYSKGPNLCVRFHSDAEGVARGFKMSYIEEEKTDNILIIGVTFLVIGVLGVGVAIGFFCWRRSNKGAVKPMDMADISIKTQERPTKAVPILLEPPVEASTLIPESSQDQVLSSQPSELTEPPPSQATTQQLSGSPSEVTALEPSEAIPLEASEEKTVEPEGLQPEQSTKPDTDSSPAE